MTTPTTELDAIFSDPGTTATSWEDTRRTLEAAELFWIATVRTDGRPHMTPLVAVWLDDALHFCTGEVEQKAVNLRGNQNVILMTGCNQWDGGLDVVVEGPAVRVTRPPHASAAGRGVGAQVGRPLGIRAGRRRLQGRGRPGVRQCDRQRSSRSPRATSATLGMCSSPRPIAPNVVRPRARAAAPRSSAGARRRDQVPDPGLGCPGPCLPRLARPDNDGRRAPAAPGPAPLAARTAARGSGRAP